MDVSRAYRAAGIELTQIGSRWRAKCPFHQEKTPSFIVYPDGAYHCFGCLAHGSYEDLLGDKSERVQIDPMDLDTIADSREFTLEKLRIKYEQDIQNKVKKLDYKMKRKCYDLFDQLWIYLRFVEFDDSVYPIELYLLLDEKYQAILSKIAPEVEC